jgi:hypothetical protein
MAQPCSSTTDSMSTGIKKCFMEWPPKAPIILKQKPCPERRNGARSSTIFKPVHRQPSGRFSVDSATENEQAISGRGIRFDDSIKMPRKPPRAIWCGASRKSRQDGFPTGPLAGDFSVRWRTKIEGKAVQTVISEAAVDSA